jgi:flagellin-like protein
MHSRGKRGISSIISTVIIVAVALTVAIASAFWVGGLATYFTRFDKFEVISSYATRDEERRSYEITLKFKNTGSADTTVIAIFLNGKPLSDFWSAVLVNGTDFDNVLVRAGETKFIVISLLDEYINGVHSAALSSGQLLEVDLQTSNGKIYLCAVTVP